MKLTSNDEWIGRRREGRGKRGGEGEEKRIEQISIPETLSLATRSRCCINKYPELHRARAVAADVINGPASDMQTTLIPFRAVN